MNKRRQWTETDKQELVDAVRRNSNLHVAFMAVSQATGHSVKSVEVKYYKMRKQNAENTSSNRKSPLRWTDEEEQCLVSNVEKSVNNLHAAFIACANEIGRTPIAVSAHWYGYTSKRLDVNVILTASRNAIARNRKNSGFVKSNPSIWRRLLRVIQTVLK